jgi:TorA maturation chaperone TorD
MKLNSFWTEKRTWAPADGGQGAAIADGEADTAAAATDTASDAASEEALADAARAADTDQAQAPVAPDYSFLPEEVRGEDGLNAEAFREHYEALAAENAQFKDSLANVPEDGKYEFAVPEDIDFGELDLPEGFAFDLQPDDEQFAPLFGELSDLMKQHNMPAEASKQMMGMLAKMEAIKASSYHTTAKAEYERLGASESQRNARISQARRAIEAKLPAEQAKALMAAATTYDGVRALETLFRPSGPGTVTPHKTTVDLEKMPASQRLKYINEQKGT